MKDLHSGGSDTGASGGGWLPAIRRAYRRIPRPRIALQFEEGRVQGRWLFADRETWIVHGFVREKNRAGRPETTVALFDWKGRRLRELGETKTDRNGYYRLRISPRRLSPAQRHALRPGPYAGELPVEVFVRGIARNGRTVAGPRNVETELGRVDYLELRANQRRRDARS